VTTLEPTEPAASDSRALTVGVVAAPGVASELAEELAERLPEELSKHFPEIDWRVEVSDAGRAEPSADSRQLIDTVRRHLLDQGWDLAIGLTDLPLRSGRRPITAQASATHGVGLVSVPAIGAVRLEQRLTTTAAHLIEGLLGESGPRGGARERGRRSRMLDRLRELATPLGHAHVREDGTVRFVSATAFANLRLLLGMVRANQPTRVILRLSRAVVGALGTGAFGITSVNVWMVADGSSSARLAGLAVFSTVVTSAALVVTHGLWERAVDPGARERVVLFNLATCLTLALGVLTLYLLLFTISALVAGAWIPPGVLEKNLEHAVGVGDYLSIAALVATMATIGGALGSMIESDAAVRDAAYRNREDERTEALAGDRA
jgi:hypothetical protein